jgi:hypothetical protein
MSHLVQEYAKSCGVKIGEPVVSCSFLPVPCARYITIQTSSIPAKEYQYWSEVFDIVKKTLAKRGISIVQIKHKDEKEISGVDYVATGSLKQLFSVVKGSILHIGIDSVFTHFAAHSGVKSITIYTNANPENIRPWKPRGKLVEIISPKNGAKFSYSNQESPRTIDLVYPEEIATNIFKSLGIKKQVTRKTLFVGSRCYDECIDIIPSESCELVSDKINVRMDIAHSEQNLSDILKRNVVEVTLFQPICNEILESRRINVINYLSNEFDKKFVMKVRSLGIQINLLCLSEGNLANQRLEFFDFDVTHLDLKANMLENAEKTKAFIGVAVKTKSNKKIVIGDKFFSNYLDALKSRELFLLDFDKQMVYTE